ncbi:MAG: ABC transporter substrate-binding protein [Clostridia bacterium]|nr:ABC transporter substrate-binding protein [Clostridia bacterium]MDH7572831.1 ABC transporter substrate-binding protein [Clostridia bacterium]
MKPGTRRLAVSVLALIVLAAFLPACAGTPQSPPSADTGQENRPQTVTVTDGIGRQVEVPQKVERIAVSYGIATHFLYALGVQDRLVGIDTPSRTNQFFLALHPGFKDLPAVGSPKEINVEQIIALKPDLVLVPGRNKEMVEQLAGKGLTVFGVVAEDLDQLMDTMSNLGRALGREERAERFNQYYRQMLDRIQSETQALEGSARPKVYLVGPMGTLSTASGEMYQHFLIEAAGGRNAAGDLKGGWVEVSPEQLIQWDPDVIVVVKYASDTSPEKILQDPRWKNIKAVQNKNVFWFPSDLTPWDYPSPQAVLGLVWLAKILHPDLFADLDPLQEANSFYKEFYGRTFSEVGGTL